MKYQEKLKLCSGRRALTILGGLALISTLLIYASQAWQLNPARKVEGSDLVPALLVLAFTLLLAFSLLYLARLHIQIDEQGIQYRYSPFHFRTQQLKWSEIQQVYSRKYSAWREFGGWGIRFNFKGNKAYNVMEDKGQAWEVVKLNGKKILFSTRKPQEVSQFLEQLSAKGRPLPLHN